MVERNLAQFYEVEVNYTAIKLNERRKTIIIQLV